MSSDNIQRKMDFIVEQQAKFSVDIELMKEAQKNLAAEVLALTSDVRKLTETVGTTQSEMLKGFNEMREGFNEMREGFNETREAINNLVVANEVTRKLSEEVAGLALQTSRRVTRLEEKV
ncbi:MAG TPA: hypothetical protein VNH22_03085 [Blastocatellia bacterium]|nr:hypothetical protein [Blastocatellia bacterium]